MADQTTTVNPEVVPSGTAVPMRRTIALPPATVCLLIGLVVGIGLGVAGVWYVKKRL